MHSTLKPEDPFSLSHCNGVHARTLHVEDFIYMLNSDQIFPDVLQLILIIIKKYAMADLHNWIKN